MNLKKQIFLILVPFFILSCGEEEDEGSVGFSLNLPGEAVIIPATSDLCNFTIDDNDDLQAAYFKIRSATINWERTDEELVLSFLKVAVKNSALDSDFSGIMDSSDLSDLFVIQTSAGTLTIQNGTIPPGSTLILRDGCSLGFGGLGVPEDSRNFTAEATFTLQGVAVGTQEGEGGNLGVESAVRTTQRIRLNYSFN